jgi:hypothetical protein
MSSFVMYTSMKYLRFLTPVACRSADVLFRLFVFIWVSGVQHILCCVLSCVSYVASFFGLSFFFYNCPFHILQCLLKVQVPFRGQNSVLYRDGNVRTLHIYKISMSFTDINLRKQIEHLKQLACTSFLRHPKTGLPPFLYDTHLLRRALTL